MNSLEMIGTNEKIKREHKNCPILGDITGFRGHFEGDVETQKSSWKSGESMTGTLVKTHNNGGYKT